MKSCFLKLSLLFPLFFVSSYLSANDDSSAKAKKFLPYLEASKAAILRVPLNANGEEMTSSAEMRVYVGEAISSQADFEPTEAWSQSVNVGNREVNASDRVDDHSTFGFFFGWRPYRSYYYYRSYYPNYSYGNYNYYYRPYSYYNNCNDGYRYYYYPRYYGYGRGHGYW
jgi:hypothetical protein